METKIVLPTEETISLAVELLRAGELVAFPTETVYGLGASVFDERAIKKIFEVKGRPSDNPLIVHISSMKQLEQLSSTIPKLFYDLADIFFPGPLTLVIQKKETVPEIASAHLPTIGIRMPNHPVAWKLIDRLGIPLVAPSANLSGKPSPTLAQHVYDDLHGKIPLILDGGACEVGIESTVLDITVTPPIILRPGHITKEQLEKALEMPILLPSLKSDTPIKAPGMKYRHYAPNATIILTRTLTEFQTAIQDIAPDETLIITNIHLPPQFAFYSAELLQEKTLYASFRQADLQKRNHIIILLDDESLQNKGLMNRIEKAVSKI